MRSEKKQKKNYNILKLIFFLEKAKKMGMRGRWYLDPLRLNRRGANPF
jgi:hypothetical protein